MNEKRHNSGFTMIELMITLVIAAILMTLAAPSFQNIIRNNRTVTNANNLLASLNIARSEAISRGVQVTIKRKGATSQNWEGGWDIFTDIDGDGTLDAGSDTLLRTASALTNGYTLRTGANYRDWLAYKSDGLVESSNGTSNDTFRLCDDTADITTSRSIAVSTTGRAGISEGTDTCP